MALYGSVLERDLFAMVTCVFFEMPLEECTGAQSCSWQSSSGPTCGCVGIVSLHDVGTICVQLTMLHWVRQLAHGCFVKSIGCWRPPQQGSPRGRGRAREGEREREGEGEGERERERERERESESERERESESEREREREREHVHIHHCPWSKPLG
jgi:hypothetical protein